LYLLKPEDEEIYYEEPKILGRIEEEDYIIVSGPKDKDLEEEAYKK
jgi:hypothetical protein